MIRTIPHSKNNLPYYKNAGLFYFHLPMDRTRRVRLMYQDRISTVENRPVGVLYLKLPCQRQQCINGLANSNIVCRVRVREIQLIRQIFNIQLNT